MFEIILEAGLATCIRIKKLFASLWNKPYKLSYGRPGISANRHETFFTRDCYEFKIHRAQKI